ncbi:MAG: DUF3393 domain-containing protein [Pseudomonadaceae bacterium]|nr:DUF3393 domain-containing protein [Pseudomonadaceae bacterium]
MNRRHFLQGLGAVSLLFPLNPIVAASTGFDDYVKQQNEGFSNYKAELEKDFAAYKKAVAEEFNNYKNKVNQVWGDKNIGSPSVLVQYSKDLNTRSIIDYEQGALTVELIENNNAEGVGVKLRKALVEIAASTVKEAYEKDTLVQNIEKRIEREASHQETAKVKSEPLISDVLTGTANPNQQQIAAAVIEISKEGKATTRPAVQSGQKVFAFSIPLDKANISKKSEQFRPLVFKYAAQEKIDPALVFAIMHSESAFNPMAKSHVPAYGLMQIVPASAGKDASEKVYGKQRLLAPSYLYNSENNIKMGCAYLNILYYRYLAKIENKESRTYCVIAAYNTGSGNVARAFGAGTNVSKAAVSINSLSPQQVYNKLVSSLPYDETRNYMKKVTPRYKAYLTEA